MNFIKVFFLTTFSLLLITQAFIYSIDPYDKYGFNPFGFETKAVAMARENKFNMVEHSRKDYGAFIIGSSSAHRIHTSDVEELTGLKTFNYAVQHTTPDDYLAMTRHILSKFRPKLILLQMDFYGLNTNFKTDTRFSTSPLYAYLEENAKAQDRSWLDMDYFTLGALSDSFKVIWVNLMGKARHIYVENGDYQKEKAPPPGPVELTQFSYDDWEVDPNRVKHLKEIKRLCDEKNVRPIVWTAPHSYEHVMQILNDEVLRKALQEYKQVLKSVFPEVYDFTNIGVKDFNSTKYFLDSTHPSRLFFQLLLQSIFRPTDTTLPLPLGQRL